jgi:tripartite-type tricarboxylate transporter receptor subunit TctC
MNLRSLLSLSAWLAALMFAGTSCPAAAAAAAQYPSKPIRFVIPFPPASFSEVVGRVVGHKLSENVGQPVVMDVRPGASGNIGAEIVASAPPDGYTLLINSFNYVANPGVMPLAFDPLKDLAPVSLIADGIPLVLVVSPSSPYRAVKDVIADARAKPGQLNFAMSGRGTSSHLAILMLQQLTGVSINQVPYKGTSQSITALIGGEIHFSMPYLSVALPLLKSGKLRSLAVTGRIRSPALPDMPTMLELGYPGLTLTGFIGLLGPAKLPPVLVKRLNAEIVKIAAQRDFIDRLAVYDLQPVAGTPEAFAQYLADEIAKWKKVFREAGEKTAP